MYNIVKYIWSQEKHFKSAIYLILLLEEGVLFYDFGFVVIFNSCISGFVYIFSHNSHNQV